MEITTDRINLGELAEFLDELREQFAPDNLPTDFSNYAVAEQDLTDMVFIKQLALIGGRERMFHSASENYYRSFAQRSKWSKDGLLKPGELKSYMKRLIEEWDLHCGVTEVRYRCDTQENKRNFGLNVFEYCQKDGAIPIRKQFAELYVARGAYHELADDFTIGWHPDFGSLLAEPQGKGDT